MISCPLDYNDSLGHGPTANQFVENIKTPLVIDQEIPETHLNRRCARYQLLNHFKKIPKLSWQSIIKYRKRHN